MGMRLRSPTPLLALAEITLILTLYKYLLILKKIQVPLHSAPSWEAVIFNCDIPDQRKGVGERQTWGG